MRTGAHTLSLSALIERFELHLDGPEGPRGWRRSHHPYPDFPPAKESGDVLHQSFAVGVVPPTTFLEEDRQRRNVGLHAQSVVAVRFTVDVQADDKRASYRRFLDLEADLVARCLEINRFPDLVLRARSIERREISGDAYLLGELRFDARHMYPIA